MRPPDISITVLDRALVFRGLLFFGNTPVQFRDSPTHGMMSGLDITALTNTCWLQYTGLTDPVIHYFISQFCNFSSPDFPI